jgi:MscS family membrane protein
LVGFPLYQWIGIFVGLPCAYLLFTLVSRILGVVLGSIRRYWSGNPGLANVDLFPVPIRMLAVALLIRFGLAHLELPLLARQFWSNVATVVTVGAVVWILLLVNGWAERRFRQRLRLQGRMGVLSVLRSASRLVALLIIIAGVAATLYHFGVSATTALAGFGVGGIALALAARTTLENILGGLSLISDNAIRIGDFLKVGDTLGTVENIGLRYTQIRTLDRSVVSIANGQMGSMTLENLSAREKFWFHPMLSLQYATTPASLRTIIDSIGNLLAQDNRVEPGSIRVRLLRFATFSLDVEIFAYVLARDWAEFLGVQEHLLLRVLEIVEEAGARIATPAQIVSRVYPAEAPRSPVTQLRAKS